MNITLDIISPLVGSHFTVQTSIGPVQLKLEEVEERPRRGLPEQFRTPLSLLFSGPASHQLSQDNYPFEHPALGPQVWTLVPVMNVGTPLAQGLAYEVLFA